MILPGIDPVTGCRSTSAHCAVRDHCYARKMAHRLRGRFGYPADDPFKPTFHPDRLEEPYKLKKPAKIFVCSMGELFGPWVPREWQEAILNVVEDNEYHTFQFLTKFPYGYAFYEEWPENVWLGTTVTGLNDDWWNPHRPRWDAADAAIKFASLEPFLGPMGLAWLRDMDWLIIGAQTNPAKQPQREWIEELVEIADRYKVPIFMKSNLRWPGPLRREFPIR